MALTADTYRNLAARSVAKAPRHVAVLPPELANQIAAGEVVERPASVVKELVENSLDAGATRVEITVEDGGRDLIRIEDDGCGMEREDALRALERHATSKLSAVEDLFNISTLGFRGEAMPSIASVSRMEIKTKTHGALSGTRVIVRAGHVEVVEDVGMPAGTTITIQDLFFNTPARLKFMKSSSTEARYTTEMLVRVGLSRPDVRFILRRDGKVRLDLPAVEDLKDRILSVLGREVYDALYPTFEFPAVNGVVARGYFSKPSHQQRTPHAIYTFVNGRYVSDKTIRAAITGAYGALLDRGRYPSVVLFLEVPCDLVDVNVHPAKHEVRFHDTTAIYRAVYHAIADALAQGPWVKREAAQERRTYTLKQHASQDASQDPPQEAGAPAPKLVSPAMAAIEPLNARHHRQFQLDAARLQPARHDFRQPGQPPLMPAAEAKITYHHLSSPPASSSPSPSSLEPSLTPQQQMFSAQGASPLIEPPLIRHTLERDASGQAVVTEQEVVEAAAGYFSSLRVIGQFKRQYILCEDASGLVIIDQHAAHERVGFERLKALFASHHKEAQQLLFSKRIELDTLRADALMEHLGFFAQAGFELEHFGGQSFALKAVPAILQRANLDKLIRDAIDDLSYHGRSDRLDEAMEAILARMACHSVVRGPTQLSVQECEALFAQMDQIDFAANCPHGRPVYYRIPLMELEASFDRR